MSAAAVCTSSRKRASIIAITVVAWASIIGVNIDVPESSPHVILKDASPGTCVGLPIGSPLLRVSDRVCCGSCIRVTLSAPLSAKVALLRPQSLTTFQSHAPWWAGSLPFTIETFHVFRPDCFSRKCSTSQSTTRHLGTHDPTQEALIDMYPNGPTSDAPFITDLFLHPCVSKFLLVALSKTYISLRYFLLR